MAITRRVSKVLKIIDVVTGKDVNKNLINITVNGKKVKPIFKKDGYIVFTDIEGEFSNIHISSSIYLSEILYESINKDIQNSEIRYVYLYPNELYPHKEILTCVSGIIDKKSNEHQNLEYYLAFKSNQTIKIAQEKVLQGEREAKLFISNNRAIFGKSFWIKAEQNSEFCRVICKKQENVYILDKVFDYNHNRGEQLYNTMKVNVDEDGVFNGFIPNKLDAKGEVFLVNDANQMIKKIQLNLE